MPGVKLPRFTAVVLTALLPTACGGSASSAETHRGRQLSAPATLSRQRTILVLTQTLGYHHMSIPTAVAAVRRLAAQDTHYRVVFLSTATELTPRALLGASAVMFLLTTGELPMSTVDKRALVAFVRRGGGLIGFHSATDTFHHWSAYKQMIGAEFSYHRHGWGTLIVEDPNNPATRGLPRRFRMYEEFYVFKHDPRPQVHVLVRLDTGPDGPDRPLVWCRRFGEGRVYYDALGHYAATWENPIQLTLAAGGIDWAVGLASAPQCTGSSDRAIDARGRARQVGLESGGLTGSRGPHA